MKTIRSGINPLFRFFYSVKPVVPRRLQILVRRAYARWIIRRNEVSWPVYEPSGRSPDGWLGWPDGRQFALVMTHDVETVRGRARVPRLMKLEEDAGIRSAYNFVPKGYDVPEELLEDLRRRGFEIGVHDLYHDGKLFRNRHTFQKHAPEINTYLRQWVSQGFRAGAMHHNLEWIADLNIAYDSSTFDIDPFEPQPDDVSTVFPFRYRNRDNGAGFVELPYTLPQDFTTFIIMKNRDIGLWTRKLDWIAEKGGMALLITHPDYMSFESGTRRIDEYPAELYVDFLRYVEKKYRDRYWNALPREVAEHVDGMNAKDTPGG